MQAFVVATAIASIALGLLLRTSHTHAGTLDRLRHASVRDPVTGLPSRLGLVDNLVAVAPDVPIAVVAVKVERLAQVWASMRRSEADAVLGEVVSRLSALLSGTDLLTRPGGSTFAILVRRPTASVYAERLARRVCNALDEPLVTPGGTAVQARAAVGIAAGAGGDRAEGLLSDALLALSAAPDQSDGVRFFKPGLREASRHQLRRDAEFKHALEAGELIPHFQPIVDLFTGRLYGFEALARWRDTEGRIFSPADFIPRAERVGLMVELDRAIMRQACVEVGGWIRRGLCPADLRLSVNVCAAQFQDGNLVESVAAAVGAVGLSPEQLHLELTEQSLVVDDRVALRALSQLKDLGVVLCVDDFGTGWSMLSYLQRYPIDVLKIDRSFIAPIGRGGSPRLAASIVAMSETLGLTAIAEGIETREQFRLVRDFGCRFGQGYHFSAPVPPEEAIRLLGRPMRPDAPSASWDRMIADPQSGDWIQSE